MPLGAAVATVVWSRATNAERSASSFGVVGAVGEAMNAVRRSRNKSFALAPARRVANSQSRPAPMAAPAVLSAPQIVR